MGSGVGFDQRRQGQLSVCFLVGLGWLLTFFFSLLPRQLYRIMEQPIATSLSTLCSRNLYTLAISLAQSRRLPPSEITEIYRRLVWVSFHRAHGLGTNPSSLDMEITSTPRVITKAPWAAISRLSASSKLLTSFEKYALVIPSHPLFFDS